MTTLRYFKYGLIALAGGMLPIGAWAQCDNYGKQASESRLKQEQLTAQYKQGVLELKQGLFCSDCHRTKSQLEKSGINFGAHIAEGARGGRRAVAATQKDYDDLHTNYEREFLREVSKVEQSNKSQADCEERERQQAFAKQQDAQRRQQDEAQRQADARRQAQEQEAQRQAEAQLLRQQQELANLQQSADQHQQLTNQNADRLQKVTESLSQVSDRIRQDVGQYTNQLRQRWNGTGSDQGTNLEDLSAPSTTDLLREDATTLGNAIYDRLLERLPGEQPAVRLLNAFGTVQSLVGAWQSIGRRDLTGLLEAIPVSPNSLWNAHIMPMVRGISRINDDAVGLLNGINVNSLLSDADDATDNEQMERNLNNFIQRSPENIPNVGWFARWNRQLNGNQPARQGNLMFNGSSFFGN